MTVSRSNDRFADFIRSFPNYTADDKVDRDKVEEQKLEGEFRYVNSRLITNSEKVAFYQDNVREKLTLLASYSKLRSHLRKFLEFRVSMGIIDNIIGKYFASIVGFYAVSIPFFAENHPLLSGILNHYNIIHRGL